MAHPHKVSEELHTLKTPSDLTEPEVKLYINATSRKILAPVMFFSGILLVPQVLLAIVALIASVPLNRLYPKLIYLVCTGLIFVISYKLYKNMDFFYIIDNVNNTISYRRSMGGIATETPICSFADLHCMSVQTRRVGASKYGSAYFVYVVALVTKAAKVTGITTECHGPRGLAMCNEFAEKLAEHFHVDFIAGEEELVVVAKYDSQIDKVIVSHMKPKTEFLSIIIFCIAIVILVLIYNAVH